MRRQASTDRDEGRAPNVMPEPGHRSRAKLRHRRARAAGAELSRPRRSIDARGAAAGATLSPLMIARWSWRAEGCRLDPWGMAIFVSNTDLIGHIWRNRPPGDHPGRQARSPNELESVAERGVITWWSPSRPGASPCGRSGDCPEHRRDRPPPQSRRVPPPVIACPPASRAYQRRVPPPPRAPRRRVPASPSRAPTGVACPPPSRAYQRRVPTRIARPTSAVSVLAQRARTPAVPLPRAAAGRLSVDAQRPGPAGAGGCP